MSDQKNSVMKVEGQKMVKIFDCFDRSLLFLLEMICVHKGQIPKVMTLLSSSKILGKMCLKVVVAFWYRGTFVLKVSNQVCYIMWNIEKKS